MGVNRFILISMWSLDYGFVNVSFHVFLSVSTTTVGEHRMCYKYMYVLY